MRQGYFLDPEEAHLQIWVTEKSLNVKHITFIFIFFIKSMLTQSELKALNAVNQSSPKLI